MRVLVACERFSRVRNAFLELGHNAWSCDLEPDDLSEAPHWGGPHLQGDVRLWLKECPDGHPWDMMIAFPPCTFLCNSGVKHLYIGGRKENGIEKSRWHNLSKAVALYRAILKAPIRRIAVENPIMHGYARDTLDLTGFIRQIIQPWQFGHGETKATCLDLKNLPPLKPTKIVKGREARVHRMAPSPERAAERGKTYQGIANAMAAQWGGKA